MGSWGPRAPDWSCCVCLTLSDSRAGVDWPPAVPVLVCSTELVANVPCLWAPGSSPDLGHLPRQGVRGREGGASRETVPEQRGLGQGRGRVLTFGLTVLEGGGALVLGEQAPSAGEAARAPRFRLVGAYGAGLAGPEAVGGEGPWRALAWKSEVRAQAGGGAPLSGPALCSALSCPGTAAGSRQQATRPGEGEECTVWPWPGLASLLLSAGRAAGREVPLL